MSPLPLGQFVRQLREKAGFSLRELARALDISPPFLSDVELGRRYPSEDTLKGLSKILKVSVQELKSHDHRDCLADLKVLIEGNPSLGFAFRVAVEELKQGKLTAKEFERRVRGRSTSRRQE